MRPLDEGNDFNLEDIDEINKKHVEELDPSEKAVFEKVGERLKRSYIEKNRIIEEYIEKQKPSKKKWGVPYEKASTSKAEFIEKSKDPLYFIRLAGVNEYFDTNENLFSFRNSGGIFSAGVCWWHSRFQRAALYLTTYRPDKPKCSEKEAKRIISNLVRGRKVSEINGFNNFYDFSKEFQGLIQKRLNIWQLIDGIFFWQWLNGLAGEYETTSEKLKKLMDKIYEEVSTRKRIGYVKVQIKGIDAHAWLITEIEKGKDGESYIFNAIDSNYPDSAFPHTYRFGDTHLFYYSKPYKCVPYLQKSYEVSKYFEAIKEYQNS